MRIFFIPIVIFTLLMVNASSLAHANCDFSVDLDTTYVVSLDTHDNHSPETPCDCCACTHHVHAFLQLSTLKTIDLNSITVYLHSRVNTLPKRYYPPSKPPIA